MNEQMVFFLVELLAPDFTFIDETTQTSYQGRTREVKSVTRAFNAYYHLTFDFELVDVVVTDYGCVVLEGLIIMRLWSAKEEGVVVRDRSTLTVCQQPEDHIWRLNEWRILESISTEKPAHGFELATWGEVKD